MEGRSVQKIPYKRKISKINMLDFHLGPRVELFYGPDHTNWNADDLLYVDCIGITEPCPDYRVVRGDSHAHFRDQYVFEYVLSGRGYIVCEGQTYTVGAGELYFLNRLHSHQYYADPADPFRKMWINISGRLVNSLVELYGISEGVVIRPYDAEDIFRELHSLVASVTMENRTELCQAISLHIHKLLTVLALSDKREPDIHDRVNRAQQIKTYIDRYSDFDLNLDEIAAHFFLNKVYLSQVFRKAYGITPKQYIVRRRIEAAQNILSNSNTPIQEIAHLLHFPSTQYFSSVFRQETSITPGQYRRQYSLSRHAENQ